MNHRTVVGAAVAFAVASVILLSLFVGGRKEGGEDLREAAWPWREVDVTFYGSYVPEVKKDKTIHVRNMKILTEDGLERDAVLYIRRGARANVVMCHPASYDKEFMVPYVKYLFSDFNCLIFDFRRHGKNRKNQISTIGMDEFYEIEASVKLLRSLPETKKLPIIGFGISMGAASLIMAEARSHMFDALVVQASFASLAEQVLKMHPLLRLLSVKKLIFSFPVRFYTRKKYGVELKDVRPADAIKKVKVPILLIHAQDDMIVPFSSFKKIYENGRHCISATWTPKSGGHTELFIVLPESYKEKVLDFLDGVLKMLDGGEKQAKKSDAKVSFLEKLFSPGVAVAAETLNLEKR